MTSLEQLNRRLENIAAHCVPNEPKQILVLDDDEGILELVQFAFQRKCQPANPYKVFKAKNGTEAHTILSQHRIDFALIDEKLPGGNSGTDLVQQWQAEGVMRCPWMLISGTTGDEERRELELRATFNGAERVLWKAPGYSWMELRPYVSAILAACSITQWQR